MRQYTGMRLIITRLMIVLTLLANVGWMADVYLIDQMSGHDPAITADGHQKDDCSPGSACHHCCHAAIHLLSIPSSSLSLNLAAAHRFTAIALPVLYSFIPAPPYQPPRA